MTLLSTQKLNARKRPLRKIIGKSRSEPRFESWLPFDEGLSAI
jgi:hypothetical protein